MRPFSDCVQFISIRSISVVSRNSIDQDPGAVVHRGDISAGGVLVMRARLVQ